MLKLEPARKRPTEASRRRFGLALAGGGPLGAFYEIGALQAIDEAFEGFDLTELDMYVGVSSGAMVAAGLANGYDTADMGVVFIHNASLEFPVEPGLFIRPALREYLARIASVPSLSLDLFKQYLSDPGKGWAEAIIPLGRIVPNGLFDNRPMERFLADLFSGYGCTNDFRRLASRLFVVATDIDSGESVRFGEPGYDHVPISLAIQASTALPGLYPPVQIDGHTYVDGALLRTMNASVLLESGVDFLICMNPIVAFDAAAVKGRARRDGKLDLARGGLLTVLSQTFRSMIQSRMQVGMATYQARYPGTDQLLFEPDRTDPEMFFKNVFSYADRKGLAERAYQRTRRDLLAAADELEPILARHGIGLRRDLLRRRSSSFATAVAERQRRLHPLTGTLHKALDRLESGLRALNS